MKELAEVARSGSLTMGSSGVGGIAHLAIEMFNTAGGGKAIHIPYTGGAPAATDVVAGHTKSLAMDLAPLQAFIEDGKMRAIAVVAGRSVMLPNVPTAIEQGYPEDERRQLVARDRRAGRARRSRSWQNHAPRLRQPTRRR
jgi:tripartite-type tricarboxylate transporter receptor subunit TctC